MTFGKDIPGNSLIHQLDPRLQIGALLIFLIAIFFDAGFIGYGIMGVFVLLVAGLSNISIKLFFFLFNFFVFFFSLPLKPVLWRLKTTYLVAFYSLCC